MHTTSAFQSISILLLLFLLSACGPIHFGPANTLAPDSTLASDSTLAPQVLTDTATFTSSPLPSATPTLTLTTTNTPAPSSTATATPTITHTPTVSPTPSLTPSPTYALPSVLVNAQAHCRYGPSKAYLHAADLYPGDAGVVWGRFAYSTWLQIKFDKLSYACWVAPSVVDVSGDITTIRYTAPDLLSIGSNQYGPPQNVRATRDGDQVTITWDRMEMTVDKDRGYFIEAWVCQNSAYLWWTVSFPDQYTTSYTVQDDSGCSLPSSGEIRTVEKHGYSEPVTIPWP